MGFGNVFSGGGDDDFWKDSGFGSGTNSNSGGSGFGGFGGFSSGFPSSGDDDDFWKDSGFPMGGGFGQSSSGGSDDYNDLVQVGANLGIKGSGKAGAASNQKILLVAREQTFMVNAIKKSLQEEDFDVLFARANSAAISSIADRPKLVIFYVDNADMAMFDALRYFRDLIQGDFDSCHIYLVGNESELNDAYTYLPKDYTRGDFPRPLNVKNLVNRIRMNQAFGDDEGSKKSILVVDDDPIMLRTLKTWLDGKYHVFMANSGANALALLARNTVDLVLLDFEMPVISGAKVLEMIRTEPSTKNMPVMFLTAKDDAQSVLSVKDLRPERYLLKTMPPDQLLRAIGDFFIKRDNR